MYVCRNEQDFCCLWRERTSLKVVAKSWCVKSVSAIYGDKMILDEALLSLESFYHTRVTGIELPQSRPREFFVLITNKRILWSKTLRNWRFPLSTVAIQIREYDLATGVFMFTPWRLFLMQKNAGHQEDSNHINIPTYQTHLRRCRSLTWHVSVMDFFYACAYMNLNLDWTWCHLIMLVVTSLAVCDVMKGLMPSVGSVSIRHTVLNSHGPVYETFPSQWLGVRLVELQSIPLLAHEDPVPYSVLLWFFLIHGIHQFSVRIWQVDVSSKNDIGCRCGRWHWFKLEKLKANLCSLLSGLWWMINTTRFQPFMCIHKTSITPLGTLKMTSVLMVA